MLSSYALRWTFTIKKASQKLGEELGVEHKWVYEIDPWIMYDEQIFGGSPIKYDWPPSGT